MDKQIRIVMAQLNFWVGDTDGNVELIRDAIQQARDELKADIIMFPELALSGYPPEDLLFRPAYIKELEQGLEQVSELASGITVIVGHPQQTNLGLFNAATVLQDRKAIATYQKHFLPNSQVFDEKRYFQPGTEPCVVEIKGVPFGVIICEDVWHADPVQTAKLAGAQALLVVNASPFSVDKVDNRRALLKAQARSVELPVVYLNLTCGQDQLVFDGASFAVDAAGEVVSQAPQFAEILWPVDCVLNADKTVSILPQEITEIASIEACMYQALVLSVRDYYQKNKFNGVILGLSGGIDSALTLAVAADAVGGENIEVLLMPSRYTREISIETAREQAQNMGVNFDELSIETAFTAFLKTLGDRFSDEHPGATEQNIQARCRGVMLMAVSNKTGALLLTTGNKSEYAVGYATLYGDMAGGYAPLKDVYKTMVYRLAQYRNSLDPVIPQRVLDRPPSAELAYEQEDVDHLPPYPILDEMLVRYIEQDMDAEQIIQDGFDAQTVHEIISMIYKNEYKRYQAPPGPKVTVKAFGRDRRYPLTHGYRDK
jgi:NAD+ synthase (glutamine-hydrolysing)